MDPSRGDSRYNLNYSMSSIGLSLADQNDLYGNPGVLGTARPPSGGLIQSMGRSTGGAGGNGGLMTHGGGGSGNGGGSSGGGQCQSLGGVQSRGIKRSSSDCYEDHHRGSGGGGGGMTSQTLQGLESCVGGGGGGNGGGGQSAGNVPDVVDDSYTAMQNKKSPPANGKKTKGRVKIKMEYIDNKLRRYTTFSKRKTGIMKKAYELSTLTGTQVMLLVASETGHVYTFATRKLQPMITSEAGKQLIQTCLNSPDPPSGGGGGDQRMSATGFEETELSYNIADEDSKDDRSPLSSANESDESSDIDSPGRPPSISNSQTMLTTDSPILEHPSNFHQHPSQGTTSSSSHFDAMKAPTLAQLGAINNVIYPASALANIPQEVLLGLVHSGHLQLHTEEDGSGHQFITIPFSMGGGNGGSGGGGGNSSSSSSFASSGSTGGPPPSAAHVSSSNSNKLHIKDFSSYKAGATATSSQSSSLLLTANGRESPPKEGITIKKEIID